MKLSLLLTTIGMANAIDVQYDGHTYNACNGTLVTVDKQGGFHNVYEGSVAIYAEASTLNFNDTGLLTASPGQTRHFKCSIHPTSTFSTTCPEDVISSSADPYSYTAITTSLACTTVGLILCRWLA